VNPHGRFAATAQGDPREQRRAVLDVLAGGGLMRRIDVEKAAFGDRQHAYETIRALRALTERKVPLVEKYGTRWRATDAGRAESRYRAITGDAAS
jgi:hypothetical protein